MIWIIFSFYLLAFRAILVHILMLRLFRCKTFYVIKFFHRKNDFLEKKNFSVWLIRKNYQRRKMTGNKILVNSVIARIWPLCRILASFVEIHCAYSDNTGQWPESYWKCRIPSNLPELRSPESNDVGLIPTSLDKLWRTGLISVTESQNSRTFGDKFMIPTNSNVRWWRIPTNLGARIKS